MSESYIEKFNTCFGDEAQNNPNIIEIQKATLGFSLIIIPQATIKKSIHISIEKLKPIFDDVENFITLLIVHHFIIFSITAYYFLPLLFFFQIFLFIFYFSSKVISKKMEGIIKYRVIYNAKDGDLDKKSNIFDNILSEKFFIKTRKNFFDSIKNSSFVFLIIFYSILTYLGYQFGFLFFIIGLGIVSSFHSTSTTIINQFNKKKLLHSNFKKIKYYYLIFTLFYGIFLGNYFVLLLIYSLCYGIISGLFEKIIVRIFEYYYNTKFYFIDIFPFLFNSELRKYDFYYDLYRAFSNGLNYLNLLNSDLENYKSGNFTGSLNKNLKKSMKELEKIMKLLNKNSVALSHQNKFKNFLKNLLNEIIEKYSEIFNYIEEYANNNLTYSKNPVEIVSTKIVEMQREKMKYIKEELIALKI